MTTASAVIVVGVDGTPASDTALAFAIDEAVRSHDSVEMVTAWDTDVALTSLDLVYGVVMSAKEHQAKATAERTKGLRRSAGAGWRALAISC